MDTAPPFPAPHPTPSPCAAADDDSAADAGQLMLAATFNGLCHVIAGMARRQGFSADELRAMHEAMLTPLDDPEHGDDPVLASARDTVDRVLGAALARRLDAAGRRRPSERR
ncbi:hypothetical protein ACFOD9_12090 [Novosphingobium bradum]|uniref:Uncharacterized protein n=1 Tax=Novosphingobium bradum TaxID=1737444 RepID=A0ABV7IQQ1_9SPHN